MTYGLVAVAGATIVGGVIASNSADKAGDAQQQATERGIATTARSQDLARSDSAPFRAAGVSAIDQLRQLLGIQPGSQGPVTQSYAGSLVDSRGGVPAPNAELYGSDAGYRKAWDDYDAAHRAHFGKGYTSDSDVSVIERAVRAALPTADSVPAPAAGPQGATSLDSPLNRTFSVDDFWKDPVVQLGYQSGLDLGTKALKNAAPLTTGLDSGAALKELTKFGADYTGQQAGASQTRFEANKTNIYNRLMGLVSGGQTANAVDASVGATTSTNNTNLISSQGNATAARTLAQGNAQAGGISSIANWWNQQQTLDRLYPRSTPTSSFYYTGGSASDPAYG